MFLKNAGEVTSEPVCVIQRSIHISVELLPVVTKINLQHTQRLSYGQEINLIPGKNANYPRVRLDDNYDIDSSPEKNDPKDSKEQPSPLRINFNPEPPEDPSKIYDPSRMYFKKVHSLGEYLAYDLVHNLIPNTAA